MTTNTDVGAWPARLLAITAKTDRESDWTLCLPAHLTDTMEVACLVWDTFVSPAVKGLVSDEVGGEDSARCLVAFLAGTHDVGKASDVFQQTLPQHATNNLARHGLRLSRISHKGQRMPHGTIGQIELRDWLCGIGQGLGAAQLAEVIGGHHGLNPSTADRQAVQLGLSLEPPVWGEVRREILDQMASRTGAAQFLPGWIAGGLPFPVRILVQAVVILSDWIASNADYFPYDDDRPSTARAADALDALGLGSPWIVRDQAPAVDALFEERFPGLAGLAPNAIQRAACELAQRARRPGLLIIEARPGEGKTEAGLMAAEVFAARFGQGGLFAGLPTMATANPMFVRVESWLNTMGGKVNSLNLAHSKAALNEDFSRLVRASRVPDVNEDAASCDVDRVRVVSWLRGRKRSLLSNIVVGTIDQFLMGGLKAKHVVLRHLALAGKVVLVDEIHAADDYMREYALTMLEWLGRYHTPVILMSATLPPDQREAYVAAYARGQGVEVAELDRKPTYPRLTLSDGSVTTRTVPKPDMPSVIAIERSDDDPETLVGLLQNALAGGGCAAVIHNTVGRAQDTYTTLHEVFGGEVVLLHSRFIAQHRLAREAELTRMLGRDGVRPRRLVVVGTQVLEQSLDIDFDLLVSDLAPIDLMLQRMGRLHRHPRKGRPARVADPRMVVVGADWQVAPPAPDRGSSQVYGKAKLLRAAAVMAPLFDAGQLELPTSIPKLVAEGYRADLEPPVGWESIWAKAEERQQRHAAEARQRARDFAIAPPPFDGDSMDGWLSAPAEDPESPRQLGRAQVRDGGDSIEVIVLQRDVEGVLRLPAGPREGTEIPENQVFDDAGLARAMAATTISLPIGMCAPNHIDATIDALERTRVPYDTWQTSPWLQGQLVLLLNESGYARVGEFDCYYSTDLGLTTMEVKGCE